MEKRLNWIYLLTNFRQKELKNRKKMKLSKERQGMLLLIGLIIFIVVAIPVTEYLLNLIINKIF